MRSLRLQGRVVTECCGPIVKRKGISCTVHVWHTHQIQKPEICPGFFQNVHHAPPALLPRWLLPVSMSQSRMFELPKAGVVWGTGSPWEGSKKQREPLGLLGARCCSGQGCVDQRPAASCLPHIRGSATPPPASLAFCGVRLSSIQHFVL